MSNDITKCSNGKCKKRKTCYRFTVEPGVIQSYAFFGMRGKCKDYWRIK